MYERSELLCYILGWIESEKHPIKRNDSLILLDQILFDMNQPSITLEEKETLKRISDEMRIFLMQMGINRERVKQIAKEGHI